MELMVARQHPQVLASDKVVGADGAGEIATIGGVVRIWLGRHLRAISAFLRDREFGFTWRGLSDCGDILFRARSGMLAGGIVGACHLDVTLGCLDGVGVVVAEFDNWDGVKHCSCYTSCSTLSWAPG